MRSNCAARNVRRVTSRVCVCGEPQRVGAAPVAYRDQSRGRAGVCPRRLLRPQELHCRARASVSVLCKPNHRRLERPHGLLPTRPCAVLRARFRPTAERSSLQGFPSRGRTDALPSRRGRFAPSGPCKAAAATGAYSNGACTDSANGLSTTYGEAPSPPSSLSMSERLTCVHTQKHTHSPVHIPTSSLAQWHVLPFAPFLWLRPASTLARSYPQRIATTLAAARAIHRTVGSRCERALHSTERTPSGLDQIYHSCVQSQQLNPKARPCTTQSPQLHRQSFCCHRCIPTLRGVSIAA